MNLDTFLSSEFARNAWIHEHSINVYVRKSVRIIDRNPVPCLDLASVEVDEEDRENGIFAEFLNRFEREAKKLNRAVYVESILNTRLIKYLEKRGYQIVPHSSDLSPNMFKIIP